MMGNKTKFFSLKARKRDFLTSWENHKRKILGKGKIGNSLTTYVENGYS